MPDLVPDWLAAWADAEPDELALHAVAGTWTVEALERDVTALARALRAMVGDLAARSRPPPRVDDGARAAPAEVVVAAMLEDDAPAVLVTHALRRLGWVHLPLNRRAVLGELAEQLRVAAATILVTDAPNESRARESGAAAGIPPAGIATIEGLVLRPAAAPVPRPDVVLDGPATIVFTSGTTGRPRAAVLTHRNHIASADAWAAVLAPRPGDRWLACLPLFHVAGLAIVLRASRWRVPLEVVPRFDPDEVVERIEAGISHLSLVPTQLDRLLAAWHGRPVPSTLRAILLGGAAIPGPSLAVARALRMPVLTTYGMTETASGVAVGGAEPATLADLAALRPLPGVRVRIGAPDPDGIGTIEVRGPMVFAGYVRDRAATDERLAGEWLRTGDLGSLDAEGLLRIADRREDLIVSGGENVFPAEVEAVLREHPDVLDAAVVGSDDASWGRVPVAVVVLAAGSTASDIELESHCQGRLAAYKVPVAFHRVAALPRNEAGKVLRRELRERLGELRERLGETPMMDMPEVRP